MLFLRFVSFRLACFHSSVISPLTPPPPLTFSAAFVKLTKEERLNLARSRDREHNAILPSFFCCCLLCSRTVKVKFIFKRFSSFQLRWLGDKVQIKLDTLRILQQDECECVCDFCHAKSSLSAFARDFDSVVSHCARFKTLARLSDVFTHACYIHINVNMAARVHVWALSHTLAHTLTHKKWAANICKARFGITRNRAWSRARTRAHMPRPGESVTAQNK